ncbi:MAG TPA: HAD-IA family hydrolase, partial [Pyrinomonadaceae bacterium]|nr:HAD-IA family hydrolase [Pyrinomonadaceae bacterium]
KAYFETLAAHAITQTAEEYFDSLGMDDETFVRAAFKRAKKNLSKEVMRAVIEREHQLHRQMIEKDLPVFPGVVTFIKAASRRYLLGVVSMAVRPEIDYVLERASLLNVFDIVVSAEDVHACKPDPACYAGALELLKRKRQGERKLPLLAEECLVIEDSPPGIESARSVGMRTLGVTNTVSESALRAAGADVVTHSLADWTVDAVHHVFDTDYH